MSEKKQVARWRKTPKATGLRAVLQRRVGGKVIIRVSWAESFDAKRPKGWYWAGLGHNTSESLVATAEEAKANADAWHKAYKCTQPPATPEVGHE
jgi:hypothetical protein